MAGKTDILDYIDELGRMAGQLGEENTKALKECDRIITVSVETNFLASETARGEAWPERKDPGPTHPLLILEGDLVAAAITGDGVITDGKVLTRTMPEGPTGTSLAGIRRHEFGDEEIMGKPGILARPYFGVSSAAADKCADTVADALVEQFVAGF